MAWFNWFSGKNNKLPAHSKGVATDVLTSQQLDSTRPMMGSKSSSSSAQPAAAASAQRLEQRRTERNAKRELLFQVVRESMVRVGVLSSAFKFKVLSLDQRGRSFLVMIELSAEFSGEVEKLAEIENMIAQTARHRFEIIVQAVYWRYFNATSAHSSSPASAPAPLLGALQAPISRPAPLFGMDGTPATTSTSSAYAATQPLQVTKAASSAAPNITGSFPIIGATASQKAAATKPVQEAKPGQEDLSDDEVAAFRRALAAGAAQGVMASAPSTTPRPNAPAVAAKAADPSTLDKARSKLLLTGYEDTEMADDDPMPALSGTQYGELR
ncbi:hypothetical protein [Variovorax sp. PCZ-1]|uniref:hypothetical protein n=1 Tax=Variovorax sp. PCZ-1 TaxID=2835533 RepID=UPI001BCFAF2D|nr:hypothetical protein [Variovorax sp. PCZ-1]MBS7806065.1 hypothetical protein [Variovorax sp. PCZ-1]